MPLRWRVLPQPDRGTGQYRAGGSALRIEHAAPGGGLVIATSNVVQPGTTLENYEAMRQTVRDFGSY
ncbi:MAG: hypothetical protein CME24_16435 [Gemmatimonadetes bacterium]|nr:hypothetical protein [Gemmatimonadota bacterium]MBD05928.1 hypothetical protein [Gemmatimonadota bacterium]